MDFNLEHKGGSKLAYRRPRTDEVSAQSLSADALAAGLTSSSIGFAVVNARQHVVYANPAFTDIIASPEQHPTASLPALIEGISSSDANMLERILASPDAASLQLTIAGERVITLNVAAIDGFTRLVMTECPACYRLTDNLFRQAPQCHPPSELDSRQMLEQAMRQWVLCHPDDTTLALILVDLDRFKQVNETLGRAVGDALLKLVTKRLKSAVREYDTVIRLGDDEFVVLYTTGSQAEEAASVARRIVDIISRPFLVEGHQINIGANAGISLYKAASDDPATPLKRAHLALHAAKADGRGVHRFFEPQMESAALERRSMEISLRRALRLKELLLHYQPQVDLRNGAVTGFEALIRWHNRERGLVSPADFIPLAEEIGEIHAIGDWVIHTACKEAASWPGQLTVAVNVSPIQFNKGDIVDIVRAALDASALAPERLELEITESTLISDTEAVTRSLCAIRELGVGIAMDDFGTGYSSLSYLNSLPFSKLKIDQTFIRGKQSPKSKALINAVLALGNSLGMTTIAEGIETQAQYDALAQGGCASAQGYLISRPMPAENIASYLSSQSK